MTGHKQGAVRTGHLCQLGARVKGIDVKPLLCERLGVSTAATPRVHDASARGQLVGQLLSNVGQIQVRGALEVALRVLSVEPQTASVLRRQAGID